MITFRHIATRFGTTLPEKFGWHQIPNTDLLSNCRRKDPPKGITDYRKT
jgi:hypothetical protein